MQQAQDRQLSVIENDINADSNSNIEASHEKKFRIYKRHKKSKLGDILLVQAFFCAVILFGVFALRSFNNEYTQKIYEAVSEAVKYDVGINDIAVKFIKDLFIKTSTHSAQPGETGSRTNEEDLNDLPVPFQVKEDASSWSMDEDTIGINSGITDEELIEGEILLNELYAEIMDSEPDNNVAAADTMQEENPVSLDEEGDIDPFAENAMPVIGYISSNFGYRMDEVSGETKLHKGVDIAADYGESVFAVYGGTVSETGYDDSYGYYVKIMHNEEMESLYAHLSEIDATTGETLKKGDLLGKVGDSGNATGPHLHLEIRINGVAKDPLNYVWISN